ncbi:hypothetical protein WN943_012693 [Citrus x changshan-huyou]
MRSCSSFQRHSQSHLGHFRARRSSSLIAAKTSCRFRSGSLSPELNGSKSNVSRTHGYQLQYAAVQVRAFNDDFDFASFDNWSDNEGTVGHMVSSSEGEESDGEIVLNSISDTDLPSVFVSNNDALTLTAHRLAMIGRARRRHRQDQTWVIYQSWTDNLLDCAASICGLVCMEDCQTALGTLLLDPSLFYFSSFSLLRRIYMRPIAQKSEDSSDHQKRRAC